MKKVFGVSCIVAVLSVVLLLQFGVITLSQQGTNPLPPQGPNNCDNPNRLNDPFGPGPHIGGNTTGAPQPPAGPPCPPVQSSPPVQTPLPEPIPPQGPNNCDDPNRLNDPFGGPHIGGNVAGSPLPPAGPPCPSVPPTPTSPVRTVGAEMLLPPKYRVGSAPFVWIKTRTPAYVYVIDVDPNKQIFSLAGVRFSTADSWYLFGEGAWLENPIGIDSMNFIASSSPLPAYLESAIMDSQNYVWAGQYYILNQTTQQQLASAGAEYLHQGYEITN